MIPDQKVQSQLHSIYKALTTLLFLVALIFLLLTIMNLNLEEEIEKHSYETSYRLQRDMTENQLETERFIQEQFAILYTELVKGGAITVTK